MNLNSDKRPKSDIFIGWKLLKFYNIWNRNILEPMGTKIHTWFWLADQLKFIFSFNSKMNIQKFQIFMLMISSFYMLPEITFLLAVRLIFGATTKPGDSRES